MRVISRAMVFMLGLLLAHAAHAACTATFTADQTGTFPGAMKLDGQSRVLTIDLSALPPDATIFRAELRLRTRGDEHRPTTPTKVHPLDHPEQAMKFVAPRFVGLDATAVVRDAVKAKQPLKLKFECTAAGGAWLEVSWLEGQAKAKPPVVANVKVSHRAGQSLIIFAEPKLADFPEFNTGGDVRAFRDSFVKEHPGLTFRIWRSAERITPASIAKAEFVGECGHFTAWNNTYHQDDTAKRPPLRYSVTDNEPVAWGTGIYAHNPPKAGKAFYAVTVTVNGEEDLSQFNDGNTTAQPIDESVGLGDPILQWIEEIPAGKEWMYRPGPLTRLIYTRWESWPDCSVPSRPIDYLVAIPAKNVDPAPVGLHMHCWGGSVNGGYGWWHNGHRGAILIASSQIPYDWWTGYHECRDTAKTFGDGRVQPFTMNRHFAFLDWAAKQWQEAPAVARSHWRKLDLTRVFTVGTSMGGSGAPMYSVRFGDRIAWSLGWVGVHVPEESPTFKNSYLNSYGPRNEAITMPDGATSPWDYFSDEWWLRKNIRSETGLIIASNGKDDGGIGWPQAVKFARALQETRRPHYFNWACQGHGTRTRIGANFDLDVRTDQSLPAFTNCTLDDNAGTATKRDAAAIAADKVKQDEEVKAKKRVEVKVDPFDGDSTGQYNAFLAWQTDDIIDTPEKWEMTVLLDKTAPKDTCNADLTPRRLQKFRTPMGKTFKYTVTDLEENKQLAAGEAKADEFDLLTLKQIPLVKGKTRVTIMP